MPGEDDRLIERREAENARLAAGSAAKPQVCTAVVVEDGEGRILLLKRGVSCSRPGHWSFPGGKLEPGETLSECCRREMFEETGPALETLRFDRLTECLGPPHLVGVVCRATAAGEPLNREIIIATRSDGSPGDRPPTR